MPSFLLSYSPGPTFHLDFGVWSSLKYTKTGRWTLGKKSQFMKWSYVHPSGPPTAKFFRLSVNLPSGNFVPVLALNLSIIRKRSSVKTQRRRTARSARKVPNQRWRKAAIVGKSPALPMEMVPAGALKKVGSEIWRIKNQRTCKYYSGTHIRTGEEIIYPYGCTIW